MGEDQVPGVVTPLNVLQLYVVLVPTLSMEAELHTHIFLPGPESTAALVQTVVNLKKEARISSENTCNWCIKNSTTENYKSPDHMLSTPAFDSV